MEDEVRFERGLGQYMVASREGKRLAIRPGRKPFSVSWAILRCTGHE